MKTRYLHIWCAKTNILYFPKLEYSNKINFMVGRAGFEPATTAV